MNADANQAPEDVRGKIANRMRAIGKGTKQPIAPEELQKLKSAANRLDDLLKAGGNAEQQTLRSAAARLGRLLSDIQAGKEVSLKLKLRQDPRGLERSRRENPDMARR